MRTRAAERKEPVAVLARAYVLESEHLSLQPVRTVAPEAADLDAAREIVDRVGYPALLRPSYVLGGRAMEIVYDDDSLDHYMTFAVQASPERPVLVDKFLQDAIEVDVDCVSDGEHVVIGGLLQHIEEAGIHSGDSACSVPPIAIKPFNKGIPKLLGDRRDVLAEDTATPCPQPPRWRGLLRRLPLPAFQHHPGLFQGAGHQHGPAARLRPQLLLSRGPPRGLLRSFGHQRGAADL